LTGYLGEEKGGFDWISRRGKVGLTGYLGEEKVGLTGYLG